jgi:Uma2 family endonuclease
MATVHAQPQPLTAEDYRQLPDGGPNYQLIEGDLFMAPAPNRFHQDVSRNLLIILAHYLNDHPIGTIYHAPFDVYLDDVNVVQPDLTYVSNENAEILTEDGVHGAPDLVIEILSPKTAHLDTKSKRVVYARSGVKELWIVEPTMRQVHVYDLVNQPDKAIRIVDENETLISSRFPDLAINVGDVFMR